MLSVQATVHQGDPRFYGSGKQCTAISYCAMLYSNVKHPSNWTSGDLDTILSEGDNLYRELSLVTTDKYLLISELPVKYKNHTFKIKRSLSGSVGRQMSEGPFLTLHDALQDIKNFCFFTVDCYTMCIMRDGQIYRVFDSHSRNDCGMSCPSGAATMTTHNTLNDLCTFIKHLCATLFQNKDDKMFEVTHIDFNRTENEISDSESTSASSFDGFSEISEGEYTCRLYETYLAEQKQNDWENISSSDCESIEKHETDVSVTSDTDATNFSDTEEFIGTSSVELDNSVLDEAMNNLNNSDVFVQSIDLNALNATHISDNYDSDNTVDYIVTLPENDENTQPSSESCNEDDIPLSFLSKKTKFEMNRNRYASAGYRSDVLKSKENLEEDLELTSNSCLDTDSNIDTDDIVEDSENVQQRGRKRVRNEKTWKRNIIKKRRNEGKNYVGRNGKFMKARAMKNPCGLNCRFKCRAKFTEEDRERLFHRYWQTGDVTKQRQFLSKFSAKSLKKRGNANTRKTFSYSYSFPLSGSHSSVRVCKLFFLSTLNVSAQMVRTAHDKIDLPGVVNEEGRGHSDASRSNKTNETQLDHVRRHIKSFPVMESHYCRKDTRRKYLQAGLTVKKMFELYRIYCSTNNLEEVSISVYRNIFDKEFNLGFFKPRKDQCDLCAAYNIANNDEKVRLAPEYRFHNINKVLARKHKKRDKKRSKTEKDLVVAVFDLEEVLLTPKGFESSLYYKRRLNTFNFTIYDYCTKDAYCYVWNETTASRGASEIASCVYDFIKIKSEQGKKKFIFFSDNCSAQNKNRFYLSMLWYCVQKFRLKYIKHKYLEKGHTENENDSVHSSVENKSKDVSVYSTPAWAAIISTARSSQPYKVKELSLDDFFDFKELSKHLINFDLNTDREKVFISKIRILLIHSQHPNMYYYWYEYSSNICKRVNFLSRLRRTAENTPNPDFIELQQLRSVPIPLSYAKYNDLVTLCLSGIVPKSNHLFYALLPHETSNYC